MSDDTKIIANVFKRFQFITERYVKFLIEYFCSSCGFEIAVRSCRSQQNASRNSCYKINHREKAKTLNVLKISSSESVSVTFRRQSDARLLLLVVRKIIGVKNDVTTERDVHGVSE